MFLQQGSRVNFLPLLPNRLHSGRATKGGHIHDRLSCACDYQTSAGSRTTLAVGTVVGARLLAKRSPGGTSFFGLPWSFCGSYHTSRSSFLRYDTLATKSGQKTYYVVCSRRVYRSRSHNHYHCCSPRHAMAANELKF